MYFEHFGLNQPPFKIVPNQEFYYSGGSRADILDKLVYAIACNDGLFIKIIGESGTGKTMLAHMLTLKAPDGLEIVQIPGAALKEGSVAWVVADAMGLNLGKLAPDRARAVLQQHLLRRQAQGRKVSLSIDEAQTLSDTAMEEIQQLASIESQPFKLMQVVIFGQPDLDKLLGDPKLTRIKELVTHHFVLKHLGKDEIGDYILFRMRAAGYRGPQVFSKQALRQVFEASKGSIRRINIVADKALLAAFLSKTHLVEKEQIEIALRESWFEPSRVAPTPKLYLGLLVVCVALTVILWALKWQAGDATPQPSEQKAAALTAPVAASPPLPVLPAPAPVATVPETPVLTAQVGVEKDDGVPEKKVAAAIEAPKPRAPVKESKAPVSAKVSVPAKEAVRPGSKGEEAKPGLSTPPNEVLGSRLENSMEWLKKQEDHYFTVQLAIASPDQALAEIQRINSKSQLKPEQLAIYRTLADGKPTIGIVSGTYPSVKEAREAIAALPPQLLDYSPLIRTFKGIRNELTKSQ